MLRYGISQGFDQDSLVDPEEVIQCDEANAASLVAGAVCGLFAFCGEGWPS